MTTQPADGFTDDDVPSWDDYADLEDVLAGPEPVWDDEPEAPPDAHRANAMLYRLDRIRRQADTDDGIAALQIEQVAEWRRSRQALHDREVAWLEEALRRYHVAVLTISPRALSINLPNGDLVSRAGQPHWEYEDETILEWLLPEAARDALAVARSRYQAHVEGILNDLVGAQRAPALTIRYPTEPALNKTGLKAVATRRDDKNKPVAWGFDSEGNAIPGVTVTPGERTFSVRLRQERPDLAAEEAEPIVSGVGSSIEPVDFDAPDGWDGSEPLS